MLISIDSLKPEALGCYPRNFNIIETFPYVIKTPTLDQLAREGTLFTNLIVQAPFTPASHASFFTGLNPPSHGIRGFFGYRLSERVETLANRLQKIGFHTCAVIGADGLNSRYGLDKGFDVYDEHFEEKMIDWFQGQYRRYGQEVTQRALKWLGKSKEPFLLFVHYFDVHLIAPHILAEYDKLASILGKGDRLPLFPETLGKVFRRLGRLYGRWSSSGKPFHIRQVQTVDKEIANLLSKLKEQGLYEQTLIVIISDHGDAFGEHGERGHRKFLYDTTLLVPLILKSVPEHKSKCIHSMVRSIDVVPTVYELLGLKAEASPGCKSLEGKSLLPVIKGQKMEERVAYSETRLEKSLENFSDLKTCYIALRTSYWKLIVNMLKDERALYNLNNDPREMRNLTTEYPEMAERLYGQLMGIYKTGGNTLTCVDCNHEERNQIEQRLKDLGYM